MRKMHSLEMTMFKMLLAVVGNRRRTALLKKSGMFAKFGENCYYCSRIIPEEPYMVRIHDNVKIAAHVNLITHDIINGMLSGKIGAKPGEVLSPYHMGTIEIFDNVVIGSDSTILYNTKIGPNAIIAAGSVVTKDVPEGAIVGGNPARVIGNIDVLIEKRKKQKEEPNDKSDLDKIIRYFWHD